MSVIKISSFGGEVPSASARSIPANSARTSKNLLASVSEFRPLKNDLAVSGVTGVVGAKTIYKLRDPTVNLGWITNTLVANYAKGQIDDDATERTYYTQSTGAPRARDNTGKDKQLGVPAPAKPTVTTIVNDEFTTEEAAAAPLNLTNEIKAAIKAAATVVLLGNAPGGSTPSSTVEGWLPHGTTTTPALPTTKAGDFAYLSPMTNASGSYQLVYPENAELQDPALFGVGVVYSGVTYWAIPVSMQATGYSVDAAALKTALLAIENPSAPGTDILTDAEATSASTDVAAAFDPASPVMAPLISAVNAAQAKVFAAAADASTAVVTSVNSAALVAAVAELKAAVGKLELAHADLVAQLITVIDGNYLSDVLLPNLPTATVDRLVESRFYVTTYVTAWGEESAPSPVSDIQEVDQNDTCVVTCPTAPTGRDIVGWRLYRSNTGSTTAAFQLADDAAAANAVLQGSTFDFFSLSGMTYTDNLKSTELDEVLPTLTWLEPPSNLRGMTGMANGVMAGYYDNCVCFCESYVPYAWPVEYQITVKYPIVGLGSFGQTLFVGTTGIPYLMSGADAASMSSIEAAGDSQACASARSIASFSTGVLYASPDGICLADVNGVKLVSQGWFTREDWSALNPSTMMGAVHDSVYYLFHDAGCYAVDLNGGKLIEVDLTGVTAVFTDKETDTLYAATASGLVALFRGTGSRTATYRTGINQTPKHTPFAWLQVDSDFSSAVTVKWYGDNSTTPKFTVAVASLAPVRLPAGRYREHEIEIQASARVTSVTMAGSTEELQSV